jgi:hypothetical protein
MKKKRALLGISLFTSLGFSTAYGQTTLDAEFRPRMEYRQGFRKPLADSVNPAFVTLQRTRLNADYKGKVLNARLSLQDARIWGNNDLKTNSSKVEINEAWFEYLISSGMSMQMGRQAITYDDGRLFCSPNWSNTGMAHDLLIVKYNSSFLTAHAGFAYNNSKDTLLNVAYAYTPKQDYKTMGYLWLSKQIYRGLTLTAIGVTEGFEKKTNPKIVYPRITYGGNLIYAKDSSAFAGTLTGYLQQGKDPNKVFGKGYADLKAFFIAAKASYKVCNKLSVNAGTDFYSGSSASIATGKSNTFNRLYGSTHGFNGSMEYFVSLPTQGLIDYYGGFSSKITSKLSIDVAAHAFYLNKNLFYKKEKINKCLGHETDITVNYSVSKEIAFQAGYSVYLNSNATSKYFKMVGVKTYSEQWAFLMITVKPQLYKTPPVPDGK